MEESRPPIMDMIAVSAPSSSDEQMDLGVVGEVEFSDFFSTRRPRHCGSGFVSGFKTIVKGVAVGVASVPVLPAVGAVNGGFGGFMGGLGGALLTSWAVPLVAVGVGALQMCRGIVNTPVSLVEEAHGKRWDDSIREWVEEDLNREALTITANDDDIFEAARLRKTVIGSGLNNAGAFGGFSSRSRSGRGAGTSAADAEQSSSGGGSDDPVVDTTYYEVLGVEPSASADQIKRQYYKMAKQTHPDKHPDDPTAAELFQKLGEAYQVLGDPESRAKYNARGKAGVAAEPKIDASVFFAVLFGSASFQHLIGHLSMASMVHAEGGLTRSDLSTLQTRREARLAQRLRAHLQGWMHEGLREAWLAGVRIECEELAKKSFGVALLHAIGNTYRLHASAFLNNALVMGGSAWATLGAAQLGANAELKGRKLDHQFGFAAASVQAFLGARRIMAQKEAGGSDAAIDNAAVEEVLPAFVETLWRGTALEIESVVGRVSDKVLFDRAWKLPTETLRVRAEALAQVGSVFCAAAEPADGSSSGGGGAAVRILVEEALRSACTPADDDGDDAEDRGEEKEEKRT
mmetsp:Transcript_23270/g.75775  ORF Transcript_23270/g.75775 Transcript_23270/m.75775 type:complete len:574 (-) Transcript_23270:79-1800(-)